MKTKMKVMMKIKDEGEDARGDNIILNIILF
jgi:hypothetical protein